MTSPNAKATMRMVVASFVAGAGAMALVGLVGPVAMQGGLSMTDAIAASMAPSAPVIEPLDVEAVEAQLEQADRTLDAMRRSTADEVNRLDRLAGR